jgi:hypothetical protein
MHRDILRSHLASIAEACRSAGARLVLQTYPHAHAMCMEADDVTREFARQEGHLLVDHGPLFDRLRAKLGRTAFQIHPRDFHLSEAGTRIFVEHLLVALESEGAPFDGAPRGGIEGLAERVLRDFRSRLAATLAPDGRSLRIRAKGPPGAKYRVVLGKALEGPSARASADDPLRAWSQTEPLLRGSFDSAQPVETVVPLPEAYPTGVPIRAALRVLHDDLQFLVGPIEVRAGALPEPSKTASRVPSAP